METLQTVLLVLQVLMAISLIGLILVQHGKGADAGAAFGSGASNTVFGSQGSGNFMTKATAILAFTFLVNSLALAWIANQRIQTVGTSVLSQPASITQPAADQTSPAINEIPQEETPAPSSDMPVIPE